MNTPSPIPYEEIMKAISNLQGEMAAIVILQNPDGSTTYLRHNISKEDMISLLAQAYPQENNGTTN